jgi:hypothetical protein
MLYCERCGQCKYISDDAFTEHYSVSGTETRYLDCRTGEVIDYGDSNIERDGGDSDYACPHCGSGSIDFDSVATAEESLNQRAEYEKGMKEIRKQREKEKLEEKIKDSDWDLVTN